MRALVRKLLLRVHPDVVASQSERNRLHNESALKTLLSTLNGVDDAPRLQRQQQPTKLFFYLREGGKTATVSLDPFNPERGLNELLGVAPLSSAPSEDGSSNEDVAFPHNKQEYSRLFREAMTTWWLSREYAESDIDRLFRQNRVRYVQNVWDHGAQVDQVDETEAVELVKETLQYHVDESTLQALHTPFCRRVELIVIHLNLYEVTREGQQLFVPSTIRPEVFGAEIDAMVDDMLLKAMRDQEHQQEHAAKGAIRETGEQGRSDF